MNDRLEIFEDVSNPLDSIEDILSGQDWVFSRLTNDELAVQVHGKECSYSLTFIWQEEYHAMQFFCEYDLRVPKKRVDLTRRALAVINESLWLGHFDITSATDAPCFRHTSLFRGMTHSSGAEHVEDLMEIALAECERHYHSFNMLATSLYMDDELLKLTLTDSAGEA